MFLSPLVLQVFLHSAQVSARGSCYPAGPTMPAPSSLSTSPVFTMATTNLTKSYDKLINNGFHIDWPHENVSFSVAVVSMYQEKPDTPIWEYHHLADANTEGTKTLDRNSQWLIGSITKVFTDYLMLKSGIDIDRSVVEYLPELVNASSLNRWDDITLRMLGSHLAGVTADYGFSEYYFLKDVVTALGFPPLNNLEYPSCGVIGLNGGCSLQEYLQGVSSSYPITAVMERPAYSNAAFNILAIALERFTGKNYTEMMAEYVCVELGMGSTHPSPGNSDRAVIPPGENGWGSDYGLNTPAGGLVSTISDLSRFSHGLLTNSLALTVAQTRAWLKPQAFAEGPYSSVGMPWEILRLSDLTPEHPHPITIYGKSGGAQSYRSQLSVLPEYGIAVIVLTAGSMGALPDIYDSALDAILPAVDGVARVQARQDYARTFSKYECQGAGATPETGLPQNVHITIEQDGNSLILGSVTMTIGENRTTELVNAMTEIWNLTIGSYTGETVGPTIRLFPTGLVGEALLPGGKSPARGEVWRLWPDLNASSPAVPTAKPSLPGAGLVSGHECMTWSVGDWVHYGREPLDRIVFYRDEQDEVVGLELPFLRSGILYPL